MKLLGLVSLFACSTLADKAKPRDEYDVTSYEFTAIEAR